MKKLLFLVSGFIIFLFAGLILTRSSQASVDYHYRYQLLTQGSSYAQGQNLEIKLYINVRNEQTQNGNVIVNYDPKVLKLSEVKKWNIFEISTDTSILGTIKINGTTETQFSGEAPIAYLYFTTLSDIADITQVLSIGPLDITEPTQTNTQVTPSIVTTSVFPTPTIINLSPEPNPEPTSTIQIPNCPTIEGNGTHRLVFIPDNYSSLDQFENDAKQAMNFIKQTNLPPANLAKFTFSYSSDISKDYEIMLTSKDVDLNIRLARETQQACDGDSFVILSNKYPTAQDSFGVGGFAFPNVGITIVFRHSLFVTPHEIGHALPGLFDEYDFQQKANVAATYYNCSGRDKARCQEWQEKYANDPEIGCFAVCGYRDWFRSTKFSAMNNNPEYMNYYNPPSLEMWATFFIQY